MVAEWETSAEPCLDPGLTRLSEILSRWRGAERALRAATAGSGGAARQLQRDVAAWRTAYQRRFAELRAGHADRTDDNDRDAI